MVSPAFPPPEEKKKSFFLFFVFLKDVAPVEFMYIVFTRMPGESYRGRLRSLLLCLCYVFQVLINSLVC